jgi:hypothetical protein
MGLPQEYLDSVRAALLPLCVTKGSVPLKAAHSAVGKAARVAQVVPVASSFVASLWGALAGAMQANAALRREAPPGHAACSRFRWAALWLLALLDGRPGINLSRRVYSCPPADRLGFGLSNVEFDASPWGGGGLLRCRDTGVVWEVFHCVWSQPLLDYFGATAGDCAFQSLWEFLTLFLSLLVWGTRYPDCVLLIQGDNIGSLANAIALKGGGSMNIVAREIALRTAWFDWQFAVEHLPAERNDEADALSRLHAVPIRPFPQSLLHSRRRETPSFEWLANAAPPAPRE